MQIKLTNGETVSCDQEVSLYPDTLYTELMLAHWAFLVDGKPWHGAGSEYPGDELTLEHVPWWLLPAYETPKPLSDDAPEHVLRYAGCTHGRYVFRNVPPGKYLLETTIYRDKGAFWMNETSGGMSTQMTPEGPELVEGGSTYSGAGAAISDGFITIGRAPLLVTTKRNYYGIDESNLRVIAHRIRV